MKSASVWFSLIRDHISLARGGDTSGAAQGMNFPANVGDSVGGAVSAKALIDLCLTENERRMGGYDARLLRSVAVPWLARIAQRFIKSN